MRKPPPVIQNVCLTPAQLVWLRKQASLNYSTISGVVRKLVDKEMSK